MKSIFLIIIGTIVAIAFLPASAFAQDEFEILGRTLTHDPTVCAFEPESDIKDAWKDLSAYTRDSVTDWEHQPVFGFENSFLTVHHLDVSVYRIARHS